MGNVGWIDLETASKRAVRSVGHLARVCRDKWRADGLAEQRTPPGGGKPTWYIREDADAALAAVKFPEQMGSDLRHVPEAKRKEAHRRLQVLQRWEKAVAAAFTLGFDKNKATGRFLEQLLIDEGTELSRATLYNWHKRFRAQGVAGLVDGRGAEADAATADPFLDEVKRLYLSLRRPKLTVCHEMAALKGEEQGWTFRSYKTCQRMIDVIPRQVLLKYRFGEEAYKNEAEPFIERDYTTLASNEAWNADHHQFDVIVNVGTRAAPRFARPWLTAFQDVRSRKIVGWAIFAHDPNTDTILTAFRRAVLAHGVPEVLFIDNGKDFDSFTLNGRTKADRWANRRLHVQLDRERTDGLFAQLQIDARHVWPYHGQAKPIERWFGFMETRTSCWPTYCGNAPTEKPEDLQLQLERGNAPTLEAFTTWFGDWLAASDANREARGDGMDGEAPDVVFAANLATRRTAKPELLDLLCLKRSKPLRVAQNGVTYNGLRYGQHEPALRKLLGAEVVIRADERDVTRVQVYTPDDRFVCIADCNAKIPFIADAQALKEAIAEKRQDRKSVKEYIDRRPRMADDLPDRMVRAAAAKRRAAAQGNDTPPATPAAPSLQPIRHPLEDQLPALQRALDHRSNKIAVGAESVSIDRVAAALADTAEPASSSFDGNALDLLNRAFNDSVEPAVEDAKS